MNFNKRFSVVANAVAHATGMPATFLACCVIVVVWAVSGPFFGYSDTWQLVINTGTTIITFLMVFLIQNTQNRDSGAIQAKLDELIRVGRGENTFIGIEHLTDEEVAQFRDRCEKAAKAHGRDVEKERSLKAKAAELAKKKQAASRGKRKPAAKSAAARKSGASASRRSK